MTRTRRLIAGLTLAATPLLTVGCTGAEVQDFFARQGHPVTNDEAERIAKVLTFLEDRATRHEDRCAPTTGAPATTAAPTTTLAVKASFRHGCDASSSNTSTGKRHR